MDKMRNNEQLKEKVKYMSPLGQKEHKVVDHNKNRALESLIKNI